MKVFAVAIALFTAPLAGIATARDIFVNNVAGDDLFDGLGAESLGSRGGPTRSIAKALRIARKGDRIIIANAGQPYFESLTLEGGRHSGYERYPFTIAGNGAVLDGSIEIPPGSWEHYQGDVFRFQPHQLRYQQLYLAGRPLPMRPVSVLAWNVPELQPLECARVQGYVYLRVQPGKLPESYDLRQTGHITGITLYQVREAQIFDLVVQGFAVDGVNVHDGVGPCYLAGLTCRGNGRAGIGVAGASRVRIEACLLGNNGESQLHVDGLTQTYVVNSDLLDNTAPAWRRKSGDLYIDGKKASGTPEKGAL